MSTDHYVFCSTVLQSLHWRGKCYFIYMIEIVCLSNYPPWSRFSTSCHKCIFQAIHPTRSEYFTCLLIFYLLILKLSFCQASKSMRENVMFVRSVCGIKTWITDYQIYLFFIIWCPEIPNYFVSNYTYICVSN